MGNEIGGRFNKGKIRHDLIAPWSLEQLAKVYTYGTIKYDDDNWWKGLKWKAEVFGCITRHIWKWFRGEQNDDESGLHHLAHAVWNCFALMEYERNQIGIDDRCPYTQDLLPEDEREKKIGKRGVYGWDRNVNVWDVRRSRFKGFVCRGLPGDGRRTL